MATRMEAIVRVRTMTADDIEAAHALSRAQQWPHRPEDWAFFLDRGQGFIAELDGAIVGSTMVWCYGADHASVGMVIVSPDVQGKGVGRRLMEVALESAGERTVLLNATDEGLRLYRALGFTVTGSILQHQGAAFAVPIPDLLPGERVRPMGAADRTAVADLDRRATGMDRKALIAALCKGSPAIVLARDTEPSGFALFRRFGRGYAIGPTIAPDIGGAKALISHWLASNAGIFCRLDVAEDSGLSVWLDELGLPCVGRVTRMVRGTAPVSGDMRAFSIVSQAFG